MIRRCALVSVLLVAWAALGSAERVIIVQGTASAPDAAERNYARRVAETVDRYLRDFNLGQALIPDEQVSARRLQGAAVAILPYSARLPDPEVAALESFVRGGGTLIVCYSADPRLARLMGMKLGAYQAVPSEGQWSAFRFNDGAPPHTPPVVRQVSRNIRPALPASAESRVIATWENGAGAPANQLAWVRSPQGYWMSHVLLDDGDEWNKQRLLIAFLGDAAPDLWKTAAAGYLASSARFRGETDFTKSLDAIARTVAGSPAEAAVAATLREAGALRARAEAAYADGDFASVLTYARRALESRVRAYGQCASPRIGEHVGVWDHSGAGLYPGDWERTAKILRRNGVTDVFVNSLWPGSAHYKSDVVPRSDTFRMHGDQMAACLAAAHAEGLRVHAWKVCWQLDTAPADLVARMRMEGRLVETDAGKVMPWLCPSHPANLQYEKDALRELLTRYAVDGVHLDYIRYPDSHTCYCAGCRARFEDVTGKKVAQWPADVKSEPLRGRFESWRAARITRLVQDLSSFGRRIRPDLQISAAVYGRYPLCMRSVGQDWGRWLDQGFVDFVCPMDYTEDLQKFRAWTREQTALPCGGERIWTGIGVTAAESRLDAVAVLDQIAVARQAGAGGFVLFDLNPTLADDILPALSLGATRAK